VENSNFTERHLFPNEVDVDLDVLHATVLNWIGRHVYGTHVVAIDYRRCFHREVQVLEELAQPAALDDNMSHRAIFGLSTRLRHGGLPLRRPRNQIVTQEDTEPRCGATGVGAAGPICIRVSGDGAGIRDTNVKTKVQGALDVPKNAPHKSKMRFPRCMHI
jgi:hypothetical protein